MIELLTFMEWQAVKGLKVGESIKKRIEAKKAYGERRTDLVLNISKERLPENFSVEKGVKLPLSNGMMGLVVDVNEKEITIDVNHELAGKALTFDMELVGFEDKVLGEVPHGLERAVFGLGCFWGRFPYLMVGACRHDACIRTY